MGLTIVVDAAVDEYYCSSTSSTGFKVILLHMFVANSLLTDWEM